MKTFKNLMEGLLQEEIQTESGSKSRKDAIALALIDRAMKGDLPAINFIRELTEKKESTGSKAEEVVRVRVITE